MSNGRAITTARETEQPMISFVKAFFALIKIGIVHSNLMTTFTGIWLAFQFTDGHFLERFDLVLCILLGAAFMVASSCAMTTYIAREIEPFRKRTKARPTVSGRFKPLHVLTISPFYYL